MKNKIVRAKKKKTSDIKTKCRRIEQGGETSVEEMKQKWTHDNKRERDAWLKGKRRREMIKVEKKSPKRMELKVVSATIFIFFTWSLILFL